MTAWERLAKSYIIREAIHTGANGDLLKCVNRITGETVAVKHVRLQKASVQNLRRLLAEI